MSDRRPRAGIYFPGLHAHGGAERLCLQLASALIESNWATTIFTDRDVRADDLAEAIGGDTARHLRSVKIRRLAESAFPRWFPQELRRQLWTASHAKEISRSDLDLLINAKYRSELPGKAKKNIYYCHFPHRLEVDARGLGHRCYLAAMRLVERSLVSHNRRGFRGTYDMFWANSHFTARNVLSRWRAAADVLYPACDRIRPLRKEKIIAVVGRFQRPGKNVPYKGHDVLLDAFSEMHDLHEIGWRLVMIGGASDEDAEYINLLKEKADGAPVELRVNASRGEVEEVLGRASLYWHAQGFGADADQYPETQEHFGMSVVEALSAEAIPLVFGSAGPAEIVAPIDGVDTWNSIDGLRRLTRMWAEASSDTASVVREACAERAGEFDFSHFRARIGVLLQQYPGGTR